MYVKRRFVALALEPQMWKHCHRLEMPRRLLTRWPVLSNYIGSGWPLKAILYRSMMCAWNSCYRAFHPGRWCAAAWSLRLCELREPGILNLHRGGWRGLSVRKPMPRAYKIYCSPCLKWNTVRLGSLEVLWSFPPSKFFSWRSSIITNQIDYSSRFPVSFYPSASFSSPFKSLNEHLPFSVRFDQTSISL